jgi:hypothetical protein
MGTKVTRMVGTIIASTNLAHTITVGMNTAIMATVLSGRT